MFGIVVDLVLIGLLWRWKGVAAAPLGGAQLPPSAHAQAVAASAT